MSEETKTLLAKEIFNRSCRTLDTLDLKYERDDEKLFVRFGFAGNDVPINFLLIVDVERQLIRLFSPLPFKMSEEKRLDGAIATVAATYNMVDGSFDYDLSDGEIVFKMTASFAGSVIGEKLFQYMIECSCAMVEEYNDKFLAINEGRLSVIDFVKQNQ